MEYSSQRFNNGNFWVGPSGCVCSRGLSCAFQASAQIPFQMLEKKVIIHNITEAVTPLEQHICTHPHVGILENPEFQENPILYPSTSMIDELHFQNPPETHPDFRILLNNMKRPSKRKPR